MTEAKKILQATWDNTQKSVFKIPGIKFPINTDQDFETLEKALMDPDFFLSAVCVLVYS